MVTPAIRIVSQLGYKKQLLSPNLARVTVPGLPYTAFDAFEYPQPWSILDTVAAAQLCVAHKLPKDDVGTLLGINNFYEHNKTVIVTTKICFSKQLYNKDIVKSPLYLDTKMSHAGKSSVVIDTEMKTELVLLAGYRNQNLCLDDSTKRPIPIPDWLRRNYDQFGDEVGPIQFPSLQKPSQEARKTRVAIGEVQYSDIDTNFHLSFSNYLKYCMDGLFKSRMSQCKSDDIHPKPLFVKSAFTWYRKECFLGDSLDIEFWEDETNATYVDMLRGDTSVFQCILEFYDAENVMSSL